ncbi:trichohyalin-like isoform X2 [Amphiprion ocellaris]|uniref:trichohyalin-like isoform X2 n=1 Tax=Amphiprion ocellaris TaxID=80972 RepID=UPI002410D85A|nr:trichohyalin-like isoform X2 [Amphiprion ocellaris]
MSSVQRLVSGRLPAAFEDVFPVFEKTVVRQEEVDRQSRLLDVSWQPEIKLHRIDRQCDCKEKTVLADQHLYNEDRNSSPDPKELKCPHIKEEQQEHCTSLNHEVFNCWQIKEEQEELCTSLKMEEPDKPQFKEEREELCTSLDQEEPKCPQIKEEQEELYTSLKREEPNSPKFKEEQEDLYISLYKEEHNFPQIKEEPIEFYNSLEQVKPESPQNKEEQEKLFTSQEEDKLVLRQETDSPLVTSTHEESDEHANSGSSESAELKSRKRRQCNNVVKCPMPESQCDTDTDEDSSKYDTGAKSQMKIHHRTHTDLYPLGHVADTAWILWNAKAEAKPDNKSLIFRVDLKSHIKLPSWTIPGQKLPLSQERDSIVSEVNYSRTAVISPHH